MFLPEQEPHPAEDKYRLLKTTVRPSRLAYLKNQSIRPGGSRYKGADADNTLKTQLILRYHFRKTYEEELQSTHIH